MKRALAILLAVLVASVAWAQPVGLIVGGTIVTGGTAGDCLKIVTPGQPLGSGGCGGAPSGSAGGDLTGTYPNPTIASLVTSGSKTVSGATTTAPSWQAQINGDSFARVAVGLNASDVARVSFGSGSLTRDLFIERVAAASLRLGTADAAAPVAQTVGVQNVLAGTTNTAGTLTTFNGSASTGSAAGGGFLFQTTPAGTSGTSQNTYAQPLFLSSASVIIGNTGRYAVGIGNNSLTGYSMRNSTTMTGSTTARGLRNDGVIQSDVTTAANNFESAPSTLAASFTLTSLRHFYANQGNVGATSAITNQYGFTAESTLTGATNNYGFYSNIASTANRWNFFANGTANNAFAGSSRFGGTTAPTEAVDVTGNVKTTGTVTIGTLATDATHTDNTVCRDTTTGLLLAGSGTVGICLGTSSVRYKTALADDVPGLEALGKLEPISYRYRPGYGDDGKRRQMGFLAEDMVKVLPQLVDLDVDGKPNSIDWPGLIPVMIQSIIELHAEVASLKAQLQKNP